VPEVISSTRSCSTCMGRCWWCPPAKRHYPDNRCYAAGSSGDLQVLSPARSLGQTLVRLRHLRARVRACSNVPPNAGRAGSSSSLWASWHKMTSCTIFSHRKENLKYTTNTTNQHTSRLISLRDSPAHIHYKY
jgi:hypothetical protein